jgi:hypothetical protein
MSSHGHRYKPTGSFRSRPPRFSFHALAALLLILIVILAMVFVGPSD